MSWSLIILLVLLLAALAWFMRRPAEQALDDPPSDDGVVDYDVLADAEAEVQDLDALRPPEEADEELRDWGPGAPKQ